MSAHFQLPCPAAEFFGGIQADQWRPEGSDIFQFQFKLHRAVGFFIFHDQPIFGPSGGQRLSNLIF